eukprot:964892-Prorocentrum_minimum.AAC.3
MCGRLRTRSVDLIGSARKSSRASEVRRGGSFYKGVFIIGECVYGSTGIRVYGDTGLRVYGDTGLRGYGSTGPQGLSTRVGVVLVLVAGGLESFLLLNSWVGTTNLLSAPVKHVQLLGWYNQPFVGPCKTCSTLDTREDRRVSGVLRAPLPLLAQEDPRNEEGMPWGADLLALVKDGRPGVEGASGVVVVLFLELEPASLTR